eukprot:TRINITY_DN14303_c0_g1_i1.p1 TRINITY_DN14303_c0_g1~~TRINITY_DN14303_c0_g1_i1.p1  ORF type:complete len:286 (-),score=31.18 TRINITY_DN14303_c0_g1_i1:255-1112(-)
MKRICLPNEMNDGTNEVENKKNRKLFQVDTPGDKSSREQIDIFQVAKEGNYEVFRSLLPRVKDINELGGGRNWSLLHYAILSNNTNLVELLLEVPEIDIEVCHCKNPGTPLYLATTRHQPNVSIIQKLLEKGASPLARDNYQKNILHSMSSDSPEIAQMIIKHRLAQDQDLVNAKIKNWTPLHSAICRDHPKMIKFLLENKANVNVDHIYTTGYKGNVFALEMLAKEEHLDLKTVNYTTFIKTTEEGFNFYQHKDHSMLRYDFSSLGFQNNEQEDNDNNVEFQDV